MSLHIFPDDGGNGKVKYSLDVRERCERVREERRGELGTCIRPIYKVV